MWSFALSSGMVRNLGVRLPFYKFLPMPGGKSAVHAAKLRDTSQISRKEGARSAVLR